MSSTSNHVSRSHADPKTRDASDLLPFRRFLNYLQFLIFTLGLVYFAWGSVTALLALFRGDALPFTMRLTEVTGTVLIDGQEPIIATLSSLGVETTALPTWQILLYGLAHVVRILAVASLIVCAFILLRRAMRWEIFSKANTVIVEWTSAALSMIGLSLVGLSLLSNTVAESLLSTTGPEHDFGIDFAIGWVLVFGSSALVLVYARGQQLQEFKQRHEQLDAPSTNELGAN